MGWTTPEAAIDWVSSVSCASSKRLRVWKGLRSISPRGISRGLPVGSATAVIDGTVAGAAGRDGRSDSRPFPRARRFGSVSAGMFLLFRLEALCPAGHAHCAWRGHFVAGGPGLGGLTCWVRPLAGLIFFFAGFPEALPLGRGEGFQGAGSGCCCSFAALFFRARYV